MLCVSCKRELPLDAFPERRWEQDKMMRGEWFALTDEDVEYIKGLQNE